MLVGILGTGWASAIVVRQSTHRLSIPAVFEYALPLVLFLFIDSCF